MTEADSEHAVPTGATPENSLREQDNRCTAMPSKQASSKSHTHLHSDLVMDPAGWLRAFLKTMTLAAQEEPMFLQTSPEVARNVTKAKGCSHLSRPQQTAPGIRYCSQGTGETNHSTPTIHPPGHQHNLQRPSTTSSGILSSITSRSQGQPSSPSNTDAQSNNTKSNDPTLSKDRDPEPSPPPSSLSPSDLTISTPSTSNAYPHSSVAKHSPSNHDTARSEITSIDLSSSTLLYSTNQVLQERFVQTTAFFQRTFSPTYRVGSLYIESWTNGTQKRGLERLRTSVERGDALMLVRNTAVQLKSLVVRSLAESRSKAMQIERERSTGTDQRSSNKQGSNKEKGSNSSSSGEGR